MCASFSPVGGLPKLDFMINLMQTKIGFLLLFSTVYVDGLAYKSKRL